MLKTVWYGLTTAAFFVGAAAACVVAMACGNRDDLGGLAVGFAAWAFLSFYTGVWVDKFLTSLEDKK